MCPKPKILNLVPLPAPVIDTRFEPSCIGLHGIRQQRAICARPIAHHVIDSPPDTRLNPHFLSHMASDDVAIGISARP